MKIYYRRSGNCNRSFAWWGWVQSSTLFKNTQKNQRTSYNLELESSLFHTTAVKWVLGLLSWGCSLTQPTVESNFNHWRWTFCLLRQFADFQQTLVFFFLDELLYAAFRSPLPYFFTFKKKYYRISIVMPAIIEFIVGILNMTLVKFNIISNQFAEVLERES